MKACPKCATLGDAIYCPECRKRGAVVLMLDRRGMEVLLEKLRKEAHWIKAAIKALGDN